MTSSTIAAQSSSNLLMESSHFSRTISATPGKPTSQMFDTTNHANRDVQLNTINDINSILSRRRSFASYLSRVTDTLCSIDREVEEVRGDVQVHNTELNDRGNLNKLLLEDNEILKVSILIVVSFIACLILNAPTFRLPRLGSSIGTPW